MRGALLALAALLLAPLAAGHLETYSQTKPLVLGPYNGVVEPYPAPAFANTAVTLRAIFSRTDTGAYVSSKDVTAEAELSYPNGTKETRALEPDGTGYFVAYFVVRQSGDHAARVTLTDAQGSHSNSTTVTVYPEVGVRLRPADMSQGDPFVGQEYPIRILVVDNVTLAPTDKIVDLKLALEHWTDDHGTLLGTTEVPLARTATGTWTGSYDFPQKGMYHLRFASSSGGFNYDQVPLLHVYATEPPAGESKESPLGPTLAILALVLVALSRRG